MPVLQTAMSIKGAKIGSFSKNPKPSLAFQISNLKDKGYNAFILKFKKKNFIYPLNINAIDPEIKSKLEKEEYTIKGIHLQEFLDPISKSRFYSCFISGRFFKNNRKPYIEFTFGLPTKQSIYEHVDLDESNSDQSLYGHILQLISSNIESAYTTDTVKSNFYKHCFLGFLTPIGYGITNEKIHTVSFDLNNFLCCLDVNLHLFKDRSNTDFDFLIFPKTYTAKIVIL